MEREYYDPQMVLPLKYIMHLIVAYSIAVVMYFWAMYEVRARKVERQQLESRMDRAYRATGEILREAVKVRLAAAQLREGLGVGDEHQQTVGGGW